MSVRSDSAQASFFDFFKTLGLDWKTAPGRTTATLLFYFTTFQGVFLIPDPLLLHGVRGNFFTALLCGLNLLAVFFFLERTERWVRSPAVWAGCALVLLGFASGLASPAPLHAELRALTVLSAGLGGFFAARKLLNTPQRAGFFMLFLAACLAALCVICLAGYVVDKKITLFVQGGSSLHMLVNRLMLLCAAPLALLFGMQGGRASRILGGLLLALALLVFYFSSIRTAVLMPLAVSGVALAFGVLRLRYFVLLVVGGALLVGGFIMTFPEKVEGLASGTNESIYYRVENYPFSWHIAKQHPLAGIGLRTERADFLDDYTVRYPYVSKATFRESVEGVVTSENIFLTAMVGLGLPFTLLYAFCALRLHARLALRTMRKQTVQGLPVLALFLPLTASLIYSLLFDNLLHPQVSWFYHALLGLIPALGAPNASEQL